MKEKSMCDKIDRLPDIKIYRNFPELKSRGHITYGCIVQANYLLFKDGDKDLPADIIIADSPIGEEFPEKLIDVARELNDYTEVSNFRVPRNVREVVKQLKDQYDMRTIYTISRLWYFGSIFMRERLCIRYILLSFFLKIRGLQCLYLQKYTVPDRKRSLSGKILTMWGQVQGLD